MRISDWSSDVCSSDLPGLTITQGGALSIDYHQFVKDDQRLRLVGNLPYNISTPLLFHLLTQSDAVLDMHFMLQKEVVDRMCATADDDAYGRLSVALVARCEVAHLFNVGPGAFSPPPKVDSAIVRLKPRTPDFAIDNLTVFDRVVAQAFSQRRKTLSNSLKGLCSAELMRSVDIDPGLRAERLHPRDFARLANALGIAG